MVKQTGFFEARAKLTLVSLDSPDKLLVEAQYNPKELGLTLPVTWTTTTPTNHQNIGVNFGGVQPQSAQIELLFDGYEANQSVQRQINTLKALALVQNDTKPSNSKPSKKKHEPRPHACLLVWGPGGDDGMPRIVCVIESIATKYLMFRSDGVPLRASCTVSLKEANLLDSEPTNTSCDWYRAEDHIHRDRNPQDR